MMWSQAAETLSPAQLAEVQSEKLVHQVEHVFAHSAVHRELYASAGVSPRDVRGIDDLHRLPFLEKDHLRDWATRHHDLFGGAACVPVAELAVVNQSTGTSGRPTTYGLSERDCDTVAEIFARNLTCMGMRSGDRTPVAAMGYWHGWVLALEFGLRRIGAVPYRIPAGAPDCVRITLENWADADFTVLRSYIPELERSLFSDGRMAIDVFPNARLAYGAFDLSEPKRRLIEASLGVPFRNSLGSGDQYFIGAECDYCAPYCHMPDDMYVFEILDLETQRPVAPGKSGELVVTNLWAEGFPYLRYRMGDIVTASDAQCPCGRTSLQLRILGRLAWSVVVGSRRVFSGEVEGVVWDEPAFAGAKYQLIRRGSRQDALEVRIAVEGDSSDIPSGSRDSVQASLAHTFNIPARVELVGTDDIGLNGMKMTRVIDASAERV